MNLIEGVESAAGKRFAIVAARWNEHYSSKLIKGATDALLQSGVSPNDITVVRVPGSFELPATCKKLALTDRFSAIIAVGTLIRGDTDHYRLIADELSRGLGEAMLSTGVPVMFGVITADNEQQAEDRTGGNAGNKGFEAALAAVEMASVFEAISSIDV